MDAKIKLNRYNAKRHGVQTDVSRILVAIPKDTPLTGDSGIVEITDKARLALNASELQNLFTLFCRKNVGGSLNLTVRQSCKEPSRVPWRNICKSFRWMCLRWCSIIRTVRTLRN